jgi:hypothetical protein
LAAAGRRASPGGDDGKGTSAAAAPARPTTLRVFVTVNEQPRNGVTVRVRAVDDLDVRATGVTDAEGVCTFPATDLRGVDVDAWGEGLCPATPSPSELEWDTNVVRFELRPGREVVGRVIDAATGAPIAGASVRAEDAEVGPTDAHGRFRVSGVAPGSVTSLVADHRDYASAYAAVRPGPTEVAEPPVELALTRARTIVGVVRDPERRPVPSAHVHVRATGAWEKWRSPDEDTPLTRAQEEELVRDLVARAHLRASRHVQPAAADGSFRLKVPPDAARIVVWAKHPDFGPSRTMETGPDVATDPVELRLRRAARLEVRVSGPGGRPEGAHIRLLQGADLDVGLGPVAVFDLASDDPAWVLVTASGLRAAVRRVVPAADTTTHVNVTLEEGGVVEGVVIDEAGSPVGEADVFAGDVALDEQLLRDRPWIRAPDHTVGNTRTTAEGRFRLTGLLDRECYVGASTRDRASWSRAPVRVRPGSPPIRITVYRRASVTARFVGEDGAPVLTTLWCEVYAGTRRIDVKRADDADVVEFPAIDEGDATLVASAKGHAWVRRTFVVRGTVPVDLGTIVLRPGARYAGTVVDRRGVPVADTRVDPPMGGPGGDNADVHGRFVLEDFPPPPFDLELDGDDILSARVRITEVPADGLRLVVTRRGRVRGQVVDADGAPAVERLFYLRRVGADAAAEEKADPDVDHDDPWQSVVSGPDGRFDHPVEPGTWAVRVDDDEAETSPTLQIFTAADGEVRDLTIRWPAAAPR